MAYGRDKESGRLKECPQRLSGGTKVMVWPTLISGPFVIFQLFLMPWIMPSY